MREIKFRAWDKINKRMLNVVTMSSGGMSNIDGVWKRGWFITGEHKTDEITAYLNGNPGYKLNQEKYNIIDIELMQFTGLLDRNGKEIYEGDIIRYNHKIKDLPLFSVLWSDDDAGWRQTFYYPGKKVKSSFCPFKLDLKAFSEVIGNIYENPEMVKE